MIFILHDEKIIDFVSITTSILDNRIVQHKNSSTQEFNPSKRLKQGDLLVLFLILSVVHVLTNNKIKNVRSQDG